MFGQELLPFLQPGMSTELRYELAGRSQAVPAARTGMVQRVGSSGQRQIINKAAAGQLPSPDHISPLL